ncbi:MAG: carbohydrate-binding domain-containing protein [Bacteroidales bacterium]|nr:carbohydrate-binding domain-containing protein [Bacteroidales bacterium]
MKRIKQIGILIALLAVSLMGKAQEETRVMQAHFAGNVVFQTPTSGIDSIKGNSQGYVTVYYSDATWSRSANQIDSLTFAWVADGDTTIIVDSLAVDTTSMISIVWNGSNVTVTNPYASNGITITTDGGHVTVKSTTTTLENVVYNLSGISSDGWLLFNKLSTPVILRLDGVQLTSHGVAAINIDKNQNAVLHLVSGTENVFADADSNADKAVVYGKGSLVVQGSGSMSITSSYVNGLQGKRGVVVNNGATEISVTSDTKKGIKSDMDFVMNGGSLNIVASGSVEVSTDTASDTGYDFSYCTGIKTGDADEGTEGNIIINGGDLTVTCPASNAGGRCLSSDYDVVFNGGHTLLTTAGTGMAVGGTGTSAVDGYASTCISTDRDIIINGGHIDARSTGKGGRGLKADGRLVVGTVGADDELIYLYVQTSGAPINAVSGGGGGPWGGGSSTDYFKGLPKCIKIEGNIYFNSGHVGAYCAQTSGDPNGEAIESKDSLFVNGGVIEANAYDDALNAASYLEINGGKLWCYSRGNDAVDCNGNTNIHGGLIIVKGQEVGLDAATDAGGHFFIDGGIIISLAGNMGAWDRPNVMGSQKYLQINNNASNGLTVKNSAGDVMLMFKSTTPSGNGFIENYTDPGAKPPPGPGGGGSNGMVFSCPELTSGTYQYWTSSTFNGGTSWHGFYIGATSTTSGNSQNATAQ